VITLVHGSCIAYPVQRFDVVITDLPYSEHVHKSAMSCAANSPGGKGAHARDLGFVHLDSPLREYAAAVSAAARRWTVLYSDCESAMSLVGRCVEHGAEYVRPIPWIRWSMPQLSADRPPQGFEMLVLLHGKQVRKHWNGPGWLTHLDHLCLRGEGKHKAEKPLDQALDLVSWFSEPGEHVTDLTFGSGTVAKACQLLGREFTGWELDAKWHAHAVERLAAPLPPRDAERFDRWVQSELDTIAKCARILAKNPESVQARRCYDVAVRDVQLALRNRL